MQGIQSNESHRRQENSRGGTCYHSFNVGPLSVFGRCKADWPPVLSAIKVCIKGTSREKRDQPPLHLSCTG